MSGLLRAWFRTHWRTSESLDRELLALRTAMEATTKWQQLALEEMRSSHAMLVAWRLSMEMPEIDVRDDVSALIRTQEDRIALFSERIVFD